MPVFDIQVWQRRRYGRTGAVDRISSRHTEAHQGFAAHAGQHQRPVREGLPLPLLVLQLYFAELTDLKASASRSGYLQALTSRNDFPGLAQAEASQQAMSVRPFAVPDPALRTPPGEPYCTYLVTYEGEAEDLNAWHSHYLENHTGRMAIFSGIRELEV
jgi:hypothetical protein